uniref:Uncharacterized protein n=1 Tax=uncultured bacterium ws020C1 TaxID=1131823 RepID=I1X4K7_9BACT|nr:hypothetical protein ws020C1_0027 [uncultured bacterium ws020C1]
MKDTRNTYRIKDLVVTLDAGNVMRNVAGLCFDCNSASGIGPCGPISPVAVQDRCYAGSEIGVKTSIYTRLTNPVVTVTEKLGTLQMMKGALQAELEQVETMEAFVTQSAQPQSLDELKVLENNLSGALEEVRAQMAQHK